MTTRFRFRVLALWMVSILPLFTNPVQGEGISRQQEKLNGGYFLLHNLSEDEAQVPLLLDLKHAPPEIVAFANRMSQAGKATGATLDRFQEKDPAIQLDRNPLPQIEKDTRDSIKGDKQHQLLFGTTGSEFVRAFLVSQIEASTYAVNLSKVLAAQESDPQRTKTLRRVSAQWLALRNDAFRILRNF
jgi:hypothetical protein